jgi:hypothetical protein
MFEFSTWHASFPDFFISLRHNTVIEKQLLLSNDRNWGRWVVLGLLQDGASTNLFENLSVKSLKGDLSNDTTANPPCFSLVNTFKFFDLDPESCQPWVLERGSKVYPGSATLIVVLVLKRLCIVLRMIFCSNIFYPLCGFFCSMPSVICGNICICPIFFFRVMILLRNCSCQIFSLSLLIDHVLLLFLDKQLSISIIVVLPRRRHF